MSVAYPADVRSVPQYVQPFESGATDRAPLRYLRLVLPQLAQVADVSSTSWLADALEELRTLKAAGVNMPGLGDFTIADDTVDRARQLVALASTTSLSAPTIVPFSGGGLALTWLKNDRSLILSVYPDKEVTYERTDAADSVVEEDTLVSDADLTKIPEIADRFIASLA